MLHEVERTAEEPGDGRAGHAQQDDEESVPDRQFRCGERKAGGRNAEGQRAAVGNEGRGKGRDKSRGKGQAHILDGHGKEGCGQRGAEQGREERGHAADGGGAAVIVFEVQQDAEVPADAAAHLQRGTLAAGRAAAQMGEHGAQKDGRDQQDADRFAALHGADDIVGAHALALRDLVQCSDEQARCGQQEKQPGLCGPQLGDALDGKVEQGAHQPADQARGDRQKKPLQRHPEGGFGFALERIKIVHRRKLLYR